MSFQVGFFEKVREVRAKLGCGLVEARDLVVSVGMENIDAKVAELLQSKVPYESKEYQIRRVIRDYYNKLDSGDDAQTARNHAFEQIEKILGMTRLNKFP